MVLVLRKSFKPQKAIDERVMFQSLTATVFILSRFRPVPGKDLTPETFVYKDYDLRKILLDNL